MYNPLFVQRRRPPSVHPALVAEAADGRAGLKPRLRIAIEVVEERGVATVVASQLEREDEACDVQ